MYLSFKKTIELANRDKFIFSQGSFAILELVMDISIIS
jgi:hypothetical protein